MAAERSLIRHVEQHARQDLALVEGEEPFLVVSDLVHVHAVVPCVEALLDCRDVPLGVRPARDHLGDVVLGEHLHRLLVVLRMR